MIPQAGDPDVLIVGDLNSYAGENPIAALESAGYTNLAKSFGGPNAYSYVFDGQWGYLDYVMASGSLLPQVTGAGDAHHNADEPSVLDYNTNFKSASQIESLYAPDRFRTSDHDPVLAGLNVSPTPTPRATTTTVRLNVVLVPLPLGLGGFAFPTATVAPANAAGTVQFKDGNTNIGNPAVVIGGIAIGPFTSLRPGAHSLTAVFIPTNPAAFGPSTSQPVSVTVK
ncbi:MAG: Ig-like domain repeat protein [Pseudonocardiaceae bacterium]